MHECYSHMHKLKLMKLKPGFRGLYTIW